MIKYKFGDIVLLSFPFTGLQSVKKRPALILFDTGDNDAVVCRITSQIFDSIYDIEINDWQFSGLLSPSCIRLHKIATIEKYLIDRKL